VLDKSNHHFYLVVGQGSTHERCALVFFFVVYCPLDLMLDSPDNRVSERG